MQTDGPMHRTSPERATSTWTSVRVGPHMAIQRLATVHHRHIQVSASSSASELQYLED